MVPVYLSSMDELRTSDHESWTFLQNNFCVNKTLGPFVALGVDHALEQVNKDIDRDKILTAQEAMEYGLIDQVLTSRKL